MSPVGGGPSPGRTHGTSGAPVVALGRLRARRHQQHRNEDNGDGEARPPKFAKYSTTKGDDEAQPPEPAKYGAVTADDTEVAEADARSLEIAKFGETRPLESARNSAAAVAKSVGDGVVRSKHKVTRRKGTDVVQAIRSSGTKLVQTGRDWKQWSEATRLQEDWAKLQLMGRTEAQRNEIGNACVEQGMQEWQQKVCEETEVLGANITRSGLHDKK